MIIVGFESSTPLGGVSLLKKTSSDFGSTPEILLAQSEFKTKSHSEVLNTFLQNLLDQSQLRLTDIDFFALGIGPGSFTGLRVSVNIVKTLAYSLNKKIIPINTLFNLAAVNFQKNPDVKKIRPMINAYKNMVYTAVYERDRKGHIHELKAPQVVRLQALSQELSNQPILCVGDGIRTYEAYLNAQMPYLILRTPECVDYPQVEMTALLAENELQSLRTRPMSWNEIVPLYIRASEAEENKRGIKFIPL